MIEENAYYEGEYRIVKEFESFWAVYYKESMDYLGLIAEQEEGFYYLDQIDTKVQILFENFDSAKEYIIHKYIKDTKLKKLKLFWLYNFFYHLKYWTIDVLDSFKRFYGKADPPY